MYTGGRTDFGGPLNPKNCLAMLIVYLSSRGMNIDTNMKQRNRKNTKATCYMLPCYRLHAAGYKAHATNDTLQATY